MSPRLHIPVAWYWWPVAIVLAALWLVTRIARFPLNLVLFAVGFGMEYLLPGQGTLSWPGLRRIWRM